MALGWLNCLFYLTLTLALGSYLRNRGPVIGLPLAVLLGSQFLVGLLPALTKIMPWFLVIPQNPESTEANAFSMLVARGQAIPDVTPIAATVAWCILFTVLAIRRFAREEL